MTDLVQKIADAVEPWIDSPLVGRERNQFHEAIRAALADAGEPVALTENEMAGCWFEAFKEYPNHATKCQVAYTRRIEALLAARYRTHPDSGRVAELEAQLAESRELAGRMREALNEAYMLMESGLDDTAFKVIAAAVAADKEKNDE